jgi:hypothetical protein
MLENIDRGVNLDYDLPTVNGYRQPLKSVKAATLRG